jgi:hypothetical protein
MIKRFIFAIALALLPTAAMAQHHDYPKHEGPKHHAANGAHNYALELIAAKADLKLTDEQIKKLEVFAVKMDEMHNKLDHHSAKPEAKAEAAKAELKLHDDLFAIFTEEQSVKVRPLMKAHMDKCEHIKGVKKQHHQLR